MLMPKRSRESYISSLDAIPQTFDHVNAIVYRYQTSSNKYHAIGFSGRRNKPDFNYYFSTEENRENYIAQWIKNIEQYLQKKQKRFDMRKNFNHSLKVGDILYASWGYEQTNVDFYEVTKVLSNKFVIIREIKHKIETTGYMSGKALPQEGAYIGDELIKKVNLNNIIKIDKVSSASLWDGTPCYCSWYG